MKKTMKAISIKAIVLTLGLGFLYSCTVDSDSPGLQFMPDMERSAAIEPYVDYGWVREELNMDLAMTKSAKHPPVHTIPYYGNIEDLEIYLPYQRKANSFAPKTHNLKAEDGWNLSTEPGGDYFESAKDQNPIALTSENEEAIFNHGKELYQINCAHCHGKTGDGKGPMVESGAYMGVPDYDNLKELKDGQVFFSIFYGKGMMGAHAPFLDNYEIWTLVHYVNKLRFEDYGANTFNQNEVESNATADAAEIEETEE